MMTHKGYSGVAEIDFDTGMIYGRVVGLRDVVTFQGETVPQAQQAFRDSVDDYLEFCASRGEPAEKPFSGRFLVRVTPELHRSLVGHAAASGVSLNALIEQTLADNFAVVDPAPEDVPPPKPKARKAKATSHGTTSSAPAAPKSAAKARATP